MIDRDDDPLKALQRVLDAIGDGALVVAFVALLGWGVIELLHHIYPHLY